MKACSQNRRGLPVVPSRFLGSTNQGAAAVFFKQYFLSCLSHASHLIGDDSSGRALVVDPQRDVSGYLADAEKNGLRIERVVETHFHADFLSGHLELAAQTGAVISYGFGAHADFPIDVLHDGQRLCQGDVTLEVRATPGHTPESICLVVYERPNDTVPSDVLTGDTLFIGDVGRPDLLASQGVTADQLAHHPSTWLRSGRCRSQAEPFSTPGIRPISPPCISGVR